MKPNISISVASFEAIKQLTEVVITIAVVLPGRTSPRSSTCSEAAVTEAVKHQLTLTGSED